MNYSWQPIIYLPSCSRIDLLFFTLVIFPTFIAISASNGGNKTDHQALLLFKSMITHDPYGALTSWNNSFHFCDWSGVTCGKRHRRVTVIDLGWNGLQGYLSPHVGNLSFLRELLLGNNSFQGTIPLELGRLSRIRYLGLDQNEFSGVIPTNLSACFNLEELYLAENKLAGSIPKEISFLSKLTFLAVHKNNLTGGIPLFLGNITTLEVFSAPGNLFGGTIPDTLGHLKSLREFYCGDCDLHGTIPRSIFNLSLLTSFSLSGNKLTGSLPADLGAMLPHLTFLQLRNNQLTGIIPPSISNCSKLTVLELHTNNFSGKVTIDFSKLRDISHIALYENNINGRGEAGEMKFIDSLQNCSHLEYLDLSNCNFQGVLPTSIGNLSDQLSKLNFGDNKLKGDLPLSIGNLVGLTRLNLDFNRFTGKIPSTIGKLQNLQIAHLNDNQLSGPIPNVIGNLSLLIRLSLSSNRLEGDIPQSLGNCHDLIELYLSENKLSGSIPKQLLQLSSLSIALDLSRNNLSSSLPIEVGDLTMLSYLDLSDNNLSGNIPSSLGGCVSLSFLYINYNSFQGTIPPSLSSLRGLVNLDLSYNNLTGQIPRFLEHFSFLEFLDLSYNDFEGEVPVLGVFSNTSEFYISGNNRLCGGLGKLGLPKCKVAVKHKKRFPLFIIIIVIAFTFVIVLCFVYVWWKKKRKFQPSSNSSTNGRFLKVSYKQLVKATDGFSQANLIGEGGFSSVYKGTLKHDNRFVAVKVLRLQDRGAKKSFRRECEVWRNIRHRNLLKIITACSCVDFQGNDFKALVYEFMPNGSLHDWLHSSERTSRLNIFQRIKILIDVASALDYLHNHCQTPIVHGDLKPSNILLDDEMVAHVGDFGLARFLRTNSFQNSSTGIRGTIGYAPPEYGLGSKMTSSGDVYSYGILLLETMTGKKPTDAMFNEGFSLHKYIDIASPDHVTDVIDGELKKFHNEDANSTKSMVANAKTLEECLALTVKIGVSCSLDSPPQRMNIQKVVHELQRILDKIQNI